MAQIEMKASGGKSPIRARRMSTAIDFTPMVDLGFLLITFFMLTTTLSKPMVMPVVFPEKDIAPNRLKSIPESCVLTLLLGKNDKIYLYSGITDPKLDSLDYSAEGIRKLILDKKDLVNREWGEEEVFVNDPITGEKIRKTRSLLTVIIKPMKESRYKNIVDTFDEMSICEVSRYVLLDISPEEEAFVAHPAAGFQFDAAAQARAVIRNGNRRQ